VEASSSRSFAELVERLSLASTNRRSDIYRDIPWDRADYELAVDDPRWELPAWDPLGNSVWYRDQTESERTAVALGRSAWFMKVAIEFEAGLQQGLLAFASTLPNRHPAFRYAYHEIIEEAQHSMMFQEYINRSPFEPPGMSPDVRRAYKGVAELGRTAPELFFLCVLSGEEPIDFLQRKQLDEQTTHPLVLEINRLHCQEEARHLAFARAYLRHHVPRMERRQFRELQYQAPLVIRWAALRMFDVPEWMQEEFAIPDSVVDQVNSAAASQTLLRRSTSRITSLCKEMRILDDRLAPFWSRAGLC
jgi:hypothetical protein